MARKSGNVFRRGRMIRSTSWIEVAATQTVLGSASASALVSVANAALLAERPFTVVRTRGYFFARSDQIAATEDWGAAMGWCTAEDAAVAIGVTAVPTPVTDQGSDSFFAYESLIGRFGFGDATGFRELGKGIVYDSKAMRKCEDDGVSPILTMETFSTVSSATISHNARMLIKLH